MNTTGTTQAEEQGATLYGEARTNQAEEMKGMECKTTGAALGESIKLNEVAAGMLSKTVDTAVTVSRLAVGIPIGIGQVTLSSVNRWFAEGSESVNKQFNAAVNRIFGVKG